MTELTDRARPGGDPGPGGPTPGAASSGLRTARDLLTRTVNSEYLVLVLTGVLVLLLLPFTDNLVSGANILNILSNFWPLVIVAVGQSFVLIVAGIDLSQTSIMAVANVAAAMIVTEAVNPAIFERSPFWGSLLNEDGGVLAGSAWAVPVAIVVAMVVGAVIGLINGLAVSRFGMPAFMVTLASFLFFAAFAIWTTRSENITGFPDSYLAVGDGSVLGFIPIAAIMALTVIVVGHLLLSRTIFGQQLYAVGANPRAALISGVPMARIVTIAYMVSGVCAALASVLYSARLEAGRPTLGANLLLDVIGACVIGGVSLFGGKGRVIGAAMGVLLFVVLANGLNLLQLPFYTVMIIKGGVILLAVFLDVVRTRRAGEST